MLTLEKAYQVLGVSPNASDEEIKKAYRTKAKETHPDAHADDPFAETKFQLLQEAKAMVDEARKSQSSHSGSSNQGQSSYSDQSHGQYERNSNDSYSGRKASNFASDRSFILEKLNAIFLFLRKNKYSDIEQNEEYREIAYRCAYGILLRHALECIVHDKAKEIRILSQGRSADELLAFLLDNHPFPARTREIYYNAKALTNKLTHIEHFASSQTTFESCKQFYNQGFKQIIEEHLASKRTKRHSYLRKVYAQLESLDIKNDITKTLLLGNVMRQMLECLVDLWIYNEGLPWDSKSSIINKMDLLRSYLRQVGPQQTRYSYATNDNLHAVRKAVNMAMHVSADNKMRISKIRKELLIYASLLDIEFKMPTGWHKTKVKKPFSFGKAILWVLFFPIMLCIKIVKSKMGLFWKLFLIYWLLPALLFYPIFIGYGIFSITSGYVEQATATSITVDMTEISNGLITGYDGYGYFTNNEICKTVVSDGEEYVITLAKDRVDESGTYFNMMVYKNSAIVKTVSVKTACTDYMSNGDLIKFEPVDKNTSQNFEIELTNTSVYVSGLEKSTDIIESDPRELFTIVRVHRESDGVYKHEWNRFKLKKEKYTVGDKTIRLSVIEDKRADAAEVKPGLKFEVFDSDDVLIATGSYTFTNLKYNAKHNDYGNTEAYSFDFKADFDPAEMLDKTGILFSGEALNYKFYD